MKIEKPKINIKPVLCLTILVLMTTLFIGHVLAQETSPPLSGNAIIFSGWMDYAEWFVIVTFFPSIIIMLFIALGLHIARPMVLRYLNRAENATDNNKQICKCRYNQQCKEHNQ